MGWSHNHNSVMADESTVLAQYRDRKITRKSAAGKLKISQRQVTRLMHKNHMIRIESPTAKVNTQRGLLHEIKQGAALAVAQQQKTIAAAAAEAGCSERTIYRRVARLKKQAKARGDGK